MKKEKGLKPVDINENVWFYPEKSYLHFVVYIGKVATQFRITKKKLEKYLLSRDK
jgi:hypothetical protein